LYLYFCHITITHDRNTIVSFSLSFANTWNLFSIYKEADERQIFGCFAAYFLGDSFWLARLLLLVYS
jgi:hypothetical protein